MSREEWIASRWVLGLVLLVSVCANLGCVRLAWAGQFEPGRKVGVVDTPLIQEASGIAASRRNAGVLWVHNDSGDRARVYAIDTTGKLLGTCTLAGVYARDWEDIALGPGPDPNLEYLYMGDIGDNDGVHRSVRVYRVPEPEIDSSRPFGHQTIGPAETIELTYADHARDAETLLLDPLTRDLYIVSKRDLLCKVFRAPYPQSTDRPSILERVCTLPFAIAVAGDVSPDGRRVIVRGPYSASLWVRPEGQPLWKAFKTGSRGIPMMAEPQGEGICFDGQGRGYYTLSEKASQPLYYFACSEEDKTQALSDK